MLIPIVAFVTFTLCTLLLIFLVRRLARLSSDPVGARLASMPIVPGRDVENDTWAESLALQLPLTTSDNGSLDQELRRSGLYHRHARRDFLASRNALVIMALLLTGAALVVSGPENSARTLQILVLGGVATVVCWALPRVLLSIRGDARVRRITEGLPFALDMLTMSLTGGLTLQHSLFHASREVHAFHPDLGVELAIVHQHAALASLETAFQQFARRIDAPEILQLAALVAQGQRLGTDVASSINEYADSLRLQRRQLADAKSSRAAIQLLLPITGLLLPSVMILLWGPAALQLWQFLLDFTGSGGPGGG